jgi:hypothetical protein
MTTTRTQRAGALQRWADDVNADDPVEATTKALRIIAELVEQRDDLAHGVARCDPRCSQG